VVERTAELAAANDTLRNEIRIRETAESDRRDLLRRLGTAQEEERRRISRDLHDQMGQLVTALGLGLKALEDSTVDPSPYRPHLVRLRELNDQIGRESHKLAMELRPTALDDLGLQAALANYVEAWSEQSSIEIDFHSTGFDGQRLDSLIETSLYRVVTEALTNVLKHGKAHRVSVILQRTPNQAIALVEDDGIGFDSESLKFSDAHLGRLGLRGMQERLTLIGGTLTIESTPGNGTTIIARVSLSNG
jgi:signal transduction histidine kinase